MDFFRKNIEETVSAVNILIEKRIKIVNVKRIREINNIPSSNRSKINFIWRSLQFLVRKKVLEENGVKKPKSYKILSTKKIEVSYL